MLFRGKTKSKQDKAQRKKFYAWLLLLVHLLNAKQRYFAFFSVTFCNCVSLFYRGGGMCLFFRIIVVEAQLKLKITS